MSTPNFTFVEEPPLPKRGHNSLYSMFAEALRSHPGKWAVWPRDLKSNAVAATTAANVKRGKLINFPEGQFEARAADGIVYVRYIGGAA